MDLDIYTKKITSEDSDEFSNLLNLCNSEKAENISLSLVYYDKGKLTDESFGKYIHDLNGSMRTLDRITESLKSGYRFDDKYAQAKIEQIEKSVNSIKPHLDFLKKYYILERN